MSTTGLDALEAKIDASKMKAGNQVLASTNLPTTASKPMYVDTDSRLQAGAIPFSVPVTPSTATATFLTLTGTATANVMTANFVVDGANGATTFTKAAYIKISITDSGGVGTNGDYYIQLGTLT